MARDRFFGRQLQDGLDQLIPGGCGHDVLVFSEQRFLHRAELGQRGFEGFDDLGGQFGRGREVFAVFQAVVFEPEDVEVGFVARDDLVVGVAFEAVGLPSAVSAAPRLLALGGPSRQGADSRRLGRRWARDGPPYLKGRL